MAYLEEKRLPPWGLDYTSILQCSVRAGLISQEKVDKAMPAFLDWCAVSLTEKAQRILDEYPHFVDIHEVRLRRDGLQHHQDVLNRGVSKYYPDDRYEGRNPEIKIVDEALGVLSCFERPFEVDAVETETNVTFKLKMSGENEKVREAVIKVVENAIGDKPDNIQVNIWQSELVESKMVGWPPKDIEITVPISRFSITDGEIHMHGFYGKHPLFSAGFHFKSVTPCNGLV